MSITMTDRYASTNRMPYRTAESDRRGRGTASRTSGSHGSGRMNSFLPDTSMIEEELKRVEYQNKFSAMFRSTLFTLVVVASAAVLVATLWMPVLRIYGVSMAPTLRDGNIVITVKDSTFRTGEIVAFYYNNKILVKRAIAQAGEWVDIDEAGNVYVNNVLIDEPYMAQENKAFGDVNIELPYQVPENRIFVLGDNRAVSVDSRNTAVGCVAEEQIVGKLVFSVWPMENFGKLQ